jgi:hypothetical protein
MMKSQLLKNEKTATQVDLPQIVFTNHLVDNVLRKINIDDRFVTIVE